MNKQKLKDMLLIAAKYNLTAKEHNGDWADENVVQIKSQIGLEFAQLETTVYMDMITDQAGLYRLCYESGRWRKWVAGDFKPEAAGAVCIYD